MPKIDDGGPAFPFVTSTGNIYTGMSLRDYFAIHSPEPSDSAVIAIANHEQQANPHGETYGNKPRRRSGAEIRAALRYQYADAMIAAREETNA